jgi:hypothetical protein
MDSKQSVVWKFFTINVANPGKANCSLRKQQQSRGGLSKKEYGTGNLRKHLVAKHSTELLEAEKEAEKGRLEKQSTDNLRKPTKAENKQQTLRELIDRNKAFQASHPRAQELTRALAEMIAIDLQPFSIVMDEGFIRLMAKAEPRYILPSDKYFRETAIPQIFERVQEKVSSILSSQTKIGITTVH